MMYISKIKDLVLIMRPRDRTMDDSRRTIIIPGKRVEFVRGRYRTDDPEMIAWLDKHEDKGAVFAPVPEEQLEVARKDAVKMVEGAMSSSNVVSGLKQGGVPAPVVTPVDLEEVKKLIQEQVSVSVNDALGQILDAIKKVPAPESPFTPEPPRPKKTFTCPFCKTAVFRSGIEVGAHKKECASRPAVL